jgi:hypothetical protein
MILHSDGVPVAFEIIARVIAILRVKPGRS